MILELGCARSSEFIACIVNDIVRLLLLSCIFLPASVLVPAFYKFFAHEFLTNRIMLAHANNFFKNHMVIDTARIRVKFSVRESTKPSRDLISP